ncbi:MAG: ribosome biogenesis GTP-binding protein YihA/YsxC [Intestinibacillus sp.]
MLNLHRAEFVRSAVKMEDCPQDGLPQIVFAGKSNVGKSSVINRLLNRKNFARVGGQPGKTVHINLFLIDERAYFVDLPGYGYAKVSKAEKERWGQLIGEYFDAGTITMGFQIVDIRHKPTADDKIMANWFLRSGVPFMVIANKLDKIKKSEREASLRLIRQTLMLPETVAVVPFSAEKGDGRDDILQQILQQIGE